MSVPLDKSAHPDPLAWPKPRQLRVPATCNPSPKMGLTHTPSRKHIAAQHTCPGFHWPHRFSITTFQHTQYAHVPVPISAIVERADGALPHPAIRYDAAWPAADTRLTSGGYMRALRPPWKLRGATMAHHGRSRASTAPWWPRCWPAGRVVRCPTGQNRFELVGLLALRDSARLLARVHGSGGHPP